MPSQSPGLPPPVDPIESLGGGIRTNGILLSRRQVVAIGAVLLCSCCLAFGLGWLFGRSVSETAAPSDATNPTLRACSLSGRIHGLIGPAVVLFLPSNNRPEEKTHIGSKSIHDLTTDSKFLTEIRAFGGELASADASGDFAAVLPDANEYFVLVLAEQGRSIMAPDTHTLAELGRYFLYGDQILTQYAWSWSRETLGDGSKLTIEF